MKFEKEYLGWKTEVRSPKSDNDLPYIELTDFLN